jgi:predicted Zn-dependent protease
MPSTKDRNQVRASVSNPYGAGGEPLGEPPAPPLSPGQQRSRVSERLIEDAVDRATLRSVMDRPDGDRISDEVIDELLAGAKTERWNDVIELTEGMKNEDDASALLCVFRGQAFRQQGFHDAAHEALKEALRSRSRAAPIRHLARAERAQNYLAQGKKGMAKKDLERILAEDSSYEGVREQLARLAES